LFVVVAERLGATPLTFVSNSSVQSSPCIVAFTFTTTAFLRIMASAYIAPNRVDICCCRRRKKRRRMRMRRKRRGISNTKRFDS
jgi:hypothetical protein